MLHTVHDLNPARLDAITSTLQRMEDDPEALNRTSQRFDSDEPPAYLSAGSTEMLTPHLYAQPPDYDTDKLLRRPLDGEELFNLRQTIRCYHPGYRFIEESRRERDRIWQQERRSWSDIAFVTAGDNYACGIRSGVFQAA